MTIVRDENYNSNNDELSVMRNLRKTNWLIILVQFRIYDAEELASDLGPQPGEGSEINPRYLPRNIIVVINCAPTNVPLYQHTNSTRLLEK